MPKFAWRRSFIGNKTNIVLINENGKIIDALRHSDPESGGRMILPGAAYTYPERRHKLDPLTTDTKAIIEAAEKSGGELSSALLNTVDGFSPLLCREVAFKAELSGSLSARLGGIISDLKGSGTPAAYKKRRHTAGFQLYGYFNTAVCLRKSVSKLLAAA